MFARSATIVAQAPMIDAGIAHVRNVVIPSMSHIDGFVGLSLMVDRSTGRCVATSGWRSVEAMHESAGRIDAIGDETARVFGGDAQVEDWEVVVMHRAHHSRPGTCMRAIWTSTDPANVVEAIESFKFDTLAKIEDLPGFCSASLLVNRESGRAVVTVAYDDRDALDRSRMPGAALREDSSRRAAAIVSDVAEFDLEIAQLHVPETV